MRLLVGVMTILAICNSFAETIETPRLGVAAIGCESEYDLLCKKLINEESAYVLDSVECRPSSLIVDNAFGGNIKNITGPIGNSDFKTGVVNLFMCADGPCIQMQAPADPGLDGSEQKSSGPIAVLEYISKIQCD
jgi:hypothetical protein